MLTIKERIREMETIKQAVKDHPMCFRLHESKNHYLVVYPLGNFPVDGVRVSRNMGSIVALRRLLKIMERHWMESYP